VTETEHLTYNIY